MPELLEKYRQLDALLTEIKDNFSDPAELEKFLWILRYAQREKPEVRFSYQIFQWLQRELEADGLSKEFGVQFSPDERRHYGDFFSLSSFKKSVVDGLFTDYDGHGEYCKGRFVSDLVVEPSDFSKLGYTSPIWATGVMWYNK